MLEVNEMTKETKETRGRPIAQSDRTAELLAHQEAAMSRRGDDWRPDSAATSKLDRPYDDPAFYYYWFSNAEHSHDTPSRGLALGFEFETWQGGPQKGEVVEQKYGATTMTLMKQPLKYRAIQLAERKAAVDRTEQGLSHVGQGEYGTMKNKAGQEIAVNQEIESSNSLTNPLMQQ
jgi:hypothetical protein